jgi:uncharacterized protein YeeX (DUF496 family)
MKTKPHKLEYQRLYRQTNRERILAYQKAYREKRRLSHPTYMSSYMKNWRQGQKKQDLALTKLLLLYACDKITVEAVKEILQPIYVKYEDRIPEPEVTQGVG